MIEEKAFNQEITDNRRINLSFNFPVFRFKCVQTTITQKDLISIYRQIKDSKIKAQIKNFIQEIDAWTDYDTDIEGQVQTRRNLLYECERVINKYDEKVN